jgi:hypothetical protein
MSGQSLCLITLLSVGLTAGCSDESSRACGRADVVTIVKEHAAEKLAGEMLAEMLVTGLHDSVRQTSASRSDSAGLTKRALSIENARAENQDRASRSYKCSAVVRRKYYLESPSGHRADLGEASSRISYRIEVSDNGALTVTSVEMQ